MRNTLRDRNRWFSAVAMTCLSGFALCGCTRGTHDLSSHLPESAGREAIEAERQVADRKRQEAGTLRSTELLASKDPSASTSRSPQKVLAEQAAEAHEWSTPGLATTGKRSPRQPADLDLETANWEGDALDRRVKVVSDDREGVVETAESLLDSPPVGAGAAELFDEEEATIQVQKPSSPSGSSVPSVRSEKPPSRPGKASFDGSSEHPWAEKAPTVASSTPAKRPAGRVSLNDHESSAESSDGASRGANSPMSSTLEAGPAQPEEPRQAEAKARIQRLLVQAKSLLHKGEYRSSYRVAQLAQRIAETEDVFFAAGETQPSDIVRSVLMKIRSEEIQLASTQDGLGQASLDGSADVVNPEVPATGVHTRPGANRLNRPEEWSAAEWKDNQGRSRSESVPGESIDNPWEESRVESPSKPRMRIEPGPSSRGPQFSSEFTGSQPVWRSASNEPLDLHATVETRLPGISTGTEGSGESRDISSKGNASSGEDNISQTEPESTAPVPVPQLFPAKSHTPVTNPLLQARQQASSEPLAVAEDWRNQDLNDLATSRMPLLVAPLPPAEPLVPGTLEMPGDDSFAMDVQEPSAPQPESRLWMILAAAAGAFAMLFVRRRPAAVVRSAAEGK